MLLVGLASLIAAQALGVLGLMRRGYEVLVAIGMMLLFLPTVAIAAGVALSF